MPFATCLKKLRNARGLSHKDFADKLGVSVPMLWRYEAGELPRPRLALEMAGRLARPEAQSEPMELLTAYVRAGGKLKGVNEEERLDAAARLLWILTRGDEP